MFTIETNTIFDLSSVIINHVYLFAGSKTYPFLKHFGDDGAVPLEDMLYLNSTLENSNLTILHDNHGDLMTNNEFKENVKAILNE